MFKKITPFTFIFYTVLVDSICSKMIFPVTASMISEMTHVGLNEAVNYGGWIMSSYAIMQLLFSPLLGGLSDRFGRRPVILLSLVGSSAGYLLMTFADSLSMLFIGRIIGGICGASITASFAYASDISSSKKKIQNFGSLGAAIGCGFILGPLLGGMLSEYELKLPFFTAALLSLFNALYGMIVLPESLRPENKRSFSFGRSNIWGAVASFIRNSTTRPLLLVLFLIFFAGQTLPAIWPFYTKLLYHWSDVKIGYSLAFAGLMIAIVKGGVIRWTNEKFGSLRSVYIGLTCSMMGFGLFAFANQSWMLYIFIGVYCLGGIASPSLQGLVSEKMSVTEQGELQGVIVSLINISNILSPLMMTAVFCFFSQKNTEHVYFPGSPFIAAALIILLGLIIYMKEQEKQKVTIPAKH